MGLAWIGPVAEMVTSVINLLPNYSQRKKEKFFKIKKELLSEIKKEPQDRNDGELGDLIDEFILFLNSFGQEIKAEKVR